MTLQLHCGSKKSKCCYTTDNFGEVLLESVFCCVYVKFDTSTTTTTQYAYFISYTFCGSNLSSIIISVISIPDAMEKSNSYLWFFIFNIFCKQVRRLNYDQNLFTTGRICCSRPKAQQDPLIQPPCIRNVYSR